MKQISLDPTVVPDALTAAECDQIIQTAEDAGFGCDIDTVDQQPAWEMNLLSYPAGEMSAKRMRDIICGLQDFFKLAQYMIYVRKYGAAYRPALAPHHDRSTVSFTVALNDDFVGGEFYYLDAEEQRHTVPLKKGDAVVFGGNVMHGVEPVAEGIRYSLVMHCI